MERVRLESLAPRGWERPALSVGNFDGVHRGHQALVAAAVEQAGRSGGTAVVLTFDPHPSRVLAPERAPSTLMTIAQRAEILEGLGVEKLAVLPFTRRLSEQSPEEFARLVLQQALGASVVVVGVNFRFGRGRSGDVPALVELGRGLGFEVRGLAPLAHEGEPISSTRVREALSRGAVGAAAQLLGRPYFVDGTVVQGVGRGRSLGIPTANLDPINETLPARGVYACRCTLSGEAAAVAAVVNVGRRPTFGGGSTVVEAHLLDFAADLYGHPLRIAFVERLREERAFPGPEALREQVQRDVFEARRVLEKGS